MYTHRRRLEGEEEGKGKKKVSLRRQTTLELSSRRRIDRRQKARENSQDSRYSVAQPAGAARTSTFLLGMGAAETEEERARARRARGARENMFLERVLGWEGGWRRGWLESEKETALEVSTKRARLRDRDSQTSAERDSETKARTYLEGEG